MSDVIIAFVQKEIGTKVANVLKKRGVNVISTVRAGAEALASADRLDSGVVICTNRLTDMMYDELFETLPRTFQMIVISKTEPEEEYPDYRFRVILTPFKVNDVIEVLEELEEIKSEHKKTRKPRARNAEDERIIGGAKLLLMNTKGMTEDEAHRYLRKMSMNNGESLRETADKLLILLG